MKRLNAGNLSKIPNPGSKQNPPQSPACAISENCSTAKAQNDCKEVREEQWPSDIAFIPFVNLAASASRKTGVLKVLTVPQKSEGEAAPLQPYY